MRSDCGTAHCAFFRYALNARSLGKTHGGRYKNVVTASLAADVVPGVGEKDAILIPVQGISSSSPRSWMKRGESSRATRKAQ